MRLKSGLDREKRLEILGEASQYDLACGVCGESRRPSTQKDRWVYPTSSPDGKSQKLLKVLQTNRCRHDCAYCAFRTGRDGPRTRFDPEELAGLFKDMHATGLAQGLFLSSAIRGRSVATMDEMLSTVDIVRNRYGFRGYVHLKLLSGVEEAQIEQALRLADRVSVNFETVSDVHLARIAPEKRLEGGLWDTMRTAHRLFHAMKANGSPMRCTGMTTQLVVGPAGETDREIVTATHRHHKEFGLKRTYFSAHNPIEGTPLEDRDPTPPWREHRLYQADFLVRQYGFKPQEMVFGPDDGLSREMDPKTGYALAHPELFPMEINRVPLEALLRVPGIGPVGAKRVLDARRIETIREPRQLAVLGVRARVAAPFLLFDGRRRLSGGLPDQLVLPF